MLIAVSGTHFIGKSTLIEDFIKAHPEYRTEMEPYYKLQDEKPMELALEPSLDDLIEQLHYSIEQINQCKNEKNVIFDRCPVDFIAYAMCSEELGSHDINDSEVAEIFPDVKDALNKLDLILFLPITKENLIDYDEDNPAYRKAADKSFKKIYRDDVCDIFPRYNHPRIIEIWGDRATRIKKIETCLT